MMRPRESRDLRLLSMALFTVPESSVTWAHDVFGNAVATATFDRASDTLVIEGTARLRLDAEPWPVFDVAASAVNYPFPYSDDDMQDLGGLRLQAYLDVSGRLREWALGFVAGPSVDTLALLKDLCIGVAANIEYEVREDEGTQTPVETLERGRGSCRDFAVLFVDAVRSLGFGARIVSGYLYGSGGAALGSEGAGSTHAWAEVFVPGAGWITFDPTNRSVGGANLIPVAVARHIRQVMPVTGSFSGAGKAFADLSVEVLVAPAETQ
jgi:transglutaminase-like putative cysteine protease